MIYLDKSGQIKLMKGADAFSEVQRVLKLEKTKSQKLIEYAFYLYAQKNNMLSRLALEQREIRLKEMGYDLSDIDVFEKELFISFVESIMLSSEERMLNAYLSKIHKYNKILQDTNSNFKQEKEAHDAINVFQPKIIELREIISQQQNGVRKSDSRLHLFEIPPDEDEQNF